MGLEWSLVPVVLIMMVAFMAVGWVSNRLGRKAIKRLIRKATAWERVGAYRGAEETFKKANTVLDSFLLSPFIKRKESIKISARLARFYLARTEKDQSSEAFIIAYLKSHPEDEEVAENWLQQVESHGSLKTDHYELAFRIGEAQPNNATIQHSLAQLYLLDGRTDFSAIQTYRQVLHSEKNAPEDIIKNLATLFLRERRADEWALRIYLQAFRLGSQQHRLLQGIAACVHWTNESKWATPLLQQARRLLANIDETQLEKLRAGFNPPIVETTEQKSATRVQIGVEPWKILKQIVSSLLSYIVSACFKIVGRTRNVINSLRRSRSSKLIILWTINILLAFGIITLMVNTTTHLIKTEKTHYEKDKTAEISVTDLFTLQVAAYLKPQDAERYVEYLKSRKLDAFWIKKKGKKRVWYQVRVSHFPNKASARAYGKKLKADGIIDDFYVANYERP